jgi:hypothetical protein
MAEKVDRWERTTHLATVIIAGCTVGALLVAIRSYQDSAEMNRRSTTAQSHALAVGVLQDYMRVAIDHPELTSRYEKHPTADRRVWFASHAYSSAEAIYNLTRGEAPWDSTVSGIVDQHDNLVKDGQYFCHDYSPAFDSLVKRVLKSEYKCVE